MPYQGSVLVKIVAIGEKVEYTKNGEQKVFLPVAIADATGMIKAICYKSEIFKKFEVNKGVMIKRFIMNDKNCIVLTQRNKVTPAGNMEELDTEPLKAAAGVLVNPWCTT